MSRPEQVHVINHPLVQQKLTRARDQGTPSGTFRRLMGEIGMLMGCEVARQYLTEPTEVRTPMGTAVGERPRRGVTLVPILRAGLGLTDGILRIMPEAHVGHLGIYRDETTLRPVVYYNKLPPQVAQTDVIVIDPMLATGGSCVAAIDAIKKAGAQTITLLCLVAAPEGIHRLTAAHPDVAVYTAAVDSHLNADGYIVPGLGDAGDRIFGTS